jgi:hypothetical protein
MVTLVRPQAPVRPQGPSRSSPAEAIMALRETVESIWSTVAQAAPETALLARRELVRRETCRLSAVIGRGVAAGAFRPDCPSWAIERLPFAIVAGACAHWVLGLSRGPSLRAGTAVEAALEILKPVARRRHGWTRRERSEP